MKSAICEIYPEFEVASKNVRAAHHQSNGQLLPHTVHCKLINLGGVQMELEHLLLAEVCLDQRGQVPLQHHPLDLTPLPFLCCLLFIHYVLQA